MDEVKESGCIWYLFLGSLLIFIGIVLGGLMKSNVFTTDHIIEPKIKLVINNNKVDTLYVYKEPIKK